MTFSDEYHNSLVAHHLGYSIHRDSRGMLEIRTKGGRFVGLRAKLEAAYRFIDRHSEGQGELEL